MKHIQLHCITRGFAYGDIVPVGDEEGQIPLEDAEQLVADRMGIEYSAPVASGSEIDQDAIDAAIAERDAAITERDAAITERDAAKAEIDMLQAELAAKGATNGKAGTSK